MVAARDAEKEQLEDLTQSLTRDKRPLRAASPSLKDGLALCASSPLEDL